jgi:hypothetical protein
LTTSFRARGFLAIRSSRSVWTTPFGSGLCSKSGNLTHTEAGSAKFSLIVEVHTYGNAEISKTHENSQLSDFATKSHW